jgi:excinuclease UvrABC ATPase subunit
MGENFVSSFVQAPQEGASDSGNSDSSIEAQVQTIGNSHAVGAATQLETAPETLLGPVGLSDNRSTRARRWSRLDSITVRNFKAVKEVTVPLGDVTILVGPNGSGKSSVLQAIHWSARAASYILPKNTKEMISFERLGEAENTDAFGNLSNLMF